MGNSGGKEEQSTNVWNEQDEGERKDSKRQADGRAAPPPQSDRAQPDDCSPMPHPEWPSDLLDITIGPPQKPHPADCIGKEENSTNVWNEQDEGEKEDFTIQADGRAAPPTQSNRQQPDDCSRMPHPKLPSDLPNTIEPSQQTQPADCIVSDCVIISNSSGKEIVRIEVGEGEKKVSTIQANLCDSTIPNELFCSMRPIQILERPSDLETRLGSGRVSLSCSVSGSGRADNLKWPSDLETRLGSGCASASGPVCFYGRAEPDDDTPMPKPNGPSDLPNPPIVIPPSFRF